MIFALKTNSGLNVSFVRFFSGSETTEIYIFFIKSYFGLVRIIFKPIFIRNTFKSSSICRSTIRPILTICRFSKVAYTVVGSIYIYVINLIQRPFSVHVKPREAMGSVMLSMNFNVNISFVMKTTRALSDTNFWPRFSPMKKPRIGIIVKDFGEGFVGDFVHA